MNVLSDLIPGARQLRAPLAIGFLWLAVAWVNEPRFDRYAKKSQLISRLTKDFSISHITVTLVVLAVSFAAYLIGIFFQILDDFVVRIVSVLVLALSIPAVIFLIIIMVFSRHWWIFPPVPVVILSVAFLYARRNHTDVGNALAQWFVNIMSLTITSGNTALRLITNIWSPATAVRDSLVSASVSKIIESHPEVVYRFCRTLRPVSLKVAYDEAKLSSDSEESYEIGGRTITLSKAASRNWIDPEGDKILRDYLLSRLLADPSIAAETITLITQPSRIRHLVATTVSKAETRIRVEHRPVFEDSDRLSSEGEFRRGVAVPMGVILSSIVAYYTARPVFIVAAALPMVLVYASGLTKDQHAAAVIVDCIAAGIVEPDLDESGDLRDLQWSMRSSADEQAAKLRLSKLFKLRNRPPRKRNPEQGRLF
ncbi:MAG TPA: hypothetical protein VMI33_10435 [Streptosporangiaceae bacterium]|nr:hypothetical protein [Streptosporangiaceae bacterium]